MVPLEKNQKFNFFLIEMIKLKKHLRLITIAFFLTRNNDAIYATKPGITRSDAKMDS